MKIVIVKDNGDLETRECEKIEPATLKPGYIIVDEYEVINLFDILRIVD